MSAKLRKKPRIQSPGSVSKRSLPKLAAQQGVKPVENFEALLGYSTPDSVAVTEFLQMLREWRKEANSRKIAS